MWVLFEMGHILCHYVLETTQFGLFHSLDNESMVMAKEKEAATFALTFTCLESCLSIEYSSKTTFDLFEV